MATIEQQIAAEIQAAPAQIEAAIALIDEGATVPFIARYRKERTGGLDDTQLRKLEERLIYLRELGQRRDAILKSISEQDKLDSALEAKIRGAQSKTELEDLYLPYKPKRRTKAMAAREAGLEPLAQALLADPQIKPDVVAENYIAPDKNIEDSAAALEGAREIVVEQINEDASLVGSLREKLRGQGRISSKLRKGKEEDGQKFSDYFSFDQDFKTVPSHRALALLRGMSEGVIALGLDLDVASDQKHPCEQHIARHCNLLDQGRPADAWRRETVHQAWKAKMHKKLVADLMQQMREGAEEEAIRVFSTNLKDLLLAAPAGPRATIGLDPGFRSGVKVAVVDATGQLLETATIYPHQPQNQWSEAVDTLTRLARRHNAEILSIGNGTASRETDKLAGEVIKKSPELKLMKVMVSEAGASVYSASERAAKEFPQLDVSLRGAVSIARRLQDPLAELVKIEPNAIGVGQYQHDVDQAALARALDAAVEDCVNAVGVELNMASSALLTYVSGLNAALAENIVAYRNENGPFRTRSELKKVARLGPKAFEQAAGFLRIADGKHPLDQSAVHPEAYPLVARIAQQTGRELESLIGDSAFLQSLDPKQFVDDQFGEPTVRDILRELEKPGRDPRPSFKAAAFAEGVEKIRDLKPGMRLEGVVTNVTNFGAFVDIGVHQDGLVHISQLADRFVSDPREIVKAGDVVSVRVVDVEVERKRIGLSMKKENDSAPRMEQKQSAKPASTGSYSSSGGDGGDNAFAAAFKKASKTKH